MSGCEIDITYTTFGQLSACRNRDDRSPTLPVADLQHGSIDEKQNEHSSSLLSALVLVKRDGRITQFSDGMQTPPHAKPLCRYHHGNVTNAPHLIEITQCFGSTPYCETQRGLMPIDRWMKSMKALVLNRRKEKKMVTVVLSDDGIQEETKKRISALCVQIFSTTC